ncbi:cobyric acid synthase [Benzoatithermus flavus]|uniref:Cobyric acid synthase n=1 Tax=Benzoatithermus flavus TaxID=3108223 RepID=A0ABU8XPG9_9PROT
MCATSLMIQGTCSNAGKSLLVAGLCRAFVRRGLVVRPFKPQNMSNNAAVTADGGEIGRAQALQARACGAAPLVDMNPVLLKPESETGAQVVVRGRVLRSCSARDYHALKPQLLPAVLESFARLRAAADLVIVEGAGSPAEINLRTGDIANMGFACAARVPVVLAGDIERGGVVAQLVGTVALLEPEERALLRGYIVNKFRGDPSLFDGAHPIITARTGLEPLGVVTWFERARDLPKEDILGLAELAGGARAAEGERPITIAVPRLPRLANFDDLDPLVAEPNVHVRILEPGQPLPPETDLVLLSGSKATLADLAALRREGWDVDILAHVRRGGRVLGLCGGYQMLGRWIADPLGLEGAPGEAPGLGLLEVDTVLEPVKTLALREAEELATGERMQGYEIHMGRTDGPGRSRPMLRMGRDFDGAVSSDGRVMGCYLHGIFAADGFRRAFLDRIRRRTGEEVAYEARIEAALDGLAAHLERCLDLDRLLAIARADDRLRC